VIGQVLTSEEVMRQVLRDIRFYENSGGGVTLSGGEPAAQRNFALSILQKCKEAGIHTALDMCGHAPWSALKELLTYTDFVLYDIKHLDPGKHRRATGRDNRLILRNARRIFQSRPMRIRVPVIPGFNDSPEAVKAIARFVKAELGPVAIDLLPYNKMGEGKYKLLGRDYSPLATQDERHMESLQAGLRRESSSRLNQDA
jgi:pyruvate formate lyase activating enzyme